MPIPYKTASPPPPSPPKKRRKASGPRKRRTQTVAEKGNDQQELYKWQQLLDSYVFSPADAINANLTERDGTWTMVVVIDGKRYVGTRDTLEEAYKSTSDLLYKHAKKFWLRQDAHVVMLPWAYSLPEV